MPLDSFRLKDVTYRIPENFKEGHLPSSSEIDFLHGLLIKAIRQEILAGNILTRAQALEFYQKEEALFYTKAPEKEGSLEDLE